jgi:hypothetical protein
MSPERDGCVTALLIIVGVILLLPGLCALIVPHAVFSLHPNPTALLAVLVACLGLVLIWYAGYRKG